jgi:hypothetical protein
MFRPVFAYPIAALALVAASARPARADAPAKELLERLAVHASAVEAMKTRASYAIAGRLERLDGDGNPDATKEMTARVVATGGEPRFVVERYVEDGEDKTEEARAKARERAAEKETKKQKDKRDIKMPFLDAEQARYAFDQVEADRTDPARVRITFVPRAPGDDTIEGSAWVDTRTGTVVSAGFKLSATPMFVDWVHVTLEFGAKTDLGPAVSKVHLEGKGGILFFRKRFRADATLSDWRVSRR